MCTWVRPRPHTHTICGQRFPPQYHISYRWGYYSAPLYECNSKSKLQIQVATYVFELTAHRPRHITHRSEHPQIFPSPSSPADWTLQRLRCCPVYAPQRCPAAEASMAIWSSFRDRRLTHAYRTMGTRRSIVDGLLLPPVFSSPHICLLLLWE
jgi:hypothetical protein